MQPITLRLANWCLGKRGLGVLNIDLTFMSLRDYLGLAIWQDTTTHNRRGIAELQLNTLLTGPPNPLGHPCLRLLFAFTDHLAKRSSGTNCSGTTLCVSSQSPNLLDCHCLLETWGVVRAGYTYHKRRLKHRRRIRKLTCHKRQQR